MYCFFKTRHYSKQKTLSKLLGFLKERLRIELFEHGVPIKQRSLSFSRQASQKKGDDILSHITAVPSAQAGLTSLFEMGRGEPRRNNHLKFLVAGCRFLLAGDSRQLITDNYQPRLWRNILTY